MRLAFVSEGFREDQLDVFREHVEQLTADALRAGGLVTRLDDRLEVLRLDIPSQLDSVMDTRVDDTAFGGCLLPDALSEAGLPHLWHRRAHSALLQALLPDGADAVVMISNTPYGRANAADIIHLSLSNSALTLDHELGHALIGLGDEYSDTDLAFPPPTERFLYPPGVEIGFRFWERLDPRWPARTLNLTTDEQNPPWRSLVDGAVEGGSRYATGIFHPTNSCAMRSDGEPYCPVCSAAIEEYLTWLDTADDGAPRCYFESYASLTPLSTRATFAEVHCSDRDGLRELEWSLDDETAYSLAPLLALEPDTQHKSAGGQVYLSLDPLPPNYAGAALTPGRHEFSLRAKDGVGHSTQLTWEFESVP